jgi:hypothetical protein
VNFRRLSFLRFFVGPVFYRVSEVGFVLFAGIEKVCNGKSHWF